MVKLLVVVVGIFVDRRLGHCCAIALHYIKVTSVSSSCFFKGVESVSGLIERVVVFSKRLCMFGLLKTMSDKCRKSECFSWSNICRVDEQRGIYTFSEHLWCLAIYDVLAVRDFNCLYKIALSVQDTVAYLRRCLM